MHQIRQNGAQNYLLFFTVLWENREKICSINLNVCIYKFLVIKFKAAI